MRSSFRTMLRARLLFAALLAVVLAACGGSDKPTVLPDETVTQPVVETVAPADTAQPTTPPTIAPTIAPSETPEPTAAAPGEELDLAGLSAPSGLDSYRATMQIMMEGTGKGQEISGTVNRDHRKGPGGFAARRKALEGKLRDAGDARWRG